MKVIYDDEKDHFREGAKDAVELIRTPADAERMKRTIVAVSQQRVAMRDEMFRHPIPKAALEAFIRGVQADIERGTFVEPA